MTYLPRRRLAVVCAGYLVLHVAFSAAARLFEVAPGVSLWYPPAGFDLAFVIMAGPRALPAVLVAHWLDMLVISHAPVTITTVALASLVAVIYGAAGWALHRRFGPLPAPKSPRGSVGLALLMLAAPATASLLGSALVLASGLVTSVGWPPLVFNWFIGDSLGVLTVTPLCLIHAAPALLHTGVPRVPLRLTPREWIEIAGQAVAVAACLMIVGAIGYVHAHQSFYLSFIPLVWICLRSGLRGATIAIFALTMGSLAVVRLVGASLETVTDVLLFEVAVATIGLGLGATVSHRSRLETERSRLLAILEATPDYIGTADLSGRVLYQNRALLRLRGHASPDQGRGRPVAEFLPDWAAARLRNESVPSALREGLWEGETAVLDARGREVPVAQRLIAHFDAEGRPTMLSSVARDLSSEKAAERTRRESERNLLQTQKMESLGVLAGGIAHDFNNLLTVILGNASLAKLDLTAGSPAERAIGQIELASHRAADLCRQMLAYSGRGRLTAAPVDLTSVVGQTADLLKVSVSKKCTLGFELRRDLPAVIGDATQLSQITMNLVMNASHACGEKAGQIVIRTGVMEADRVYLAGAYLAPSLPPGSYVYLEVSDNGCGMTPEVLGRIFEPFFTTRFGGHGLGLSAVLGIARSHHGAIKVDSTPGRGSTFRVLLPATTAAVPAAPASAAAAVEWRGSGDVLVVDDEEAVRHVAARILERQGFAIVHAGHGRQAVELVAAGPDRFRAVLLDLSMPVMNGAEASRKIHQLNPRLPVILMSGYNKTDSASRFATDGLSGFVQKPFDTAGLVEVVRAVLARG